MSWDLTIVFVLIVLLIVILQLIARYFAPVCANCGHRPLEQFDASVFYDPAPGWSLYRCSSCGSDYIYIAGNFILRTEWTGDPDAEQTFQELEAK